MAAPLRPESPFRVATASSSAATSSSSSASEQRSVVKYRRGELLESPSPSAIRISSKEMMLPPLLDTFFGLAAGGVLPARAEGASQAGVPGEVNRGAAVQAASPATAAVPGSEVAKEHKRAPRASARSPLQKGGFPPPSFAARLSAPAEQCLRSGEPGLPGGVLRESRTSNPPKRWGRYSP